jgi:hypothetical protein
VPGYTRSPEEAAEDRAYGTVGAAYLALGFALQGLSYFGVALDACATVKGIVAFAALGVGTALAVAAYGLVYMSALPRLDRDAARRYPGIELGALRRAPDGLRFWHFERVRDEPPT